MVRRKRRQVRLRWKAEQRDGGKRADEKNYERRKRKRRKRRRRRDT